MCVFRNSPHLPHHRADLLFYQLKWNLNTKSWTQRVTIRCINELARSCVQICVKSKRKSTYESFRKCLIYRLWSHLGLNQGKIAKGLVASSLAIWGVVPLGLEPRTPWLWVRCSNQLSYRTGFWALVVLLASAKIRRFFDISSILGRFFHSMPRFLAQIGVK